MNSTSRTERITLSLPTDLLAKLRAASDGNLSRYVATTLSEHFERQQRYQIREALIAGYLESREDDLETAEAFAYVEWEAGQLAEVEADAEAPTDTLVTAAK